MTKLSDLHPAKGSTQRRKRVGIGSSSGHGGTSGRGHKGQNSRSGGGVPTWFEGGQTPLIRRLPKRGFKNIWRVANQVVNVRDLSRFEAGSTVDREAMIEAGLVHKSGGPVKILALGDVSHAVTIKVDKISEAARKKVESAGGTVEVLAPVAKPKAKG